MSMTITVFHCYGLLISEGSAALILEHVLPLWKKTKPDLYERFQGADAGSDFCDYLCNEYGICLNGTADYMRSWRICDGEESDMEINDSFYFMDLLKAPSLFEKAYGSFEDVIRECQERLPDLLPPHFPYEQYLLEIIGEVWG